MPVAGSERLKEFTTVKRLGKGAFGDVFKVLRKSDNKHYALKKVNISSMSTREVQDALNEIRFLASVRHPNIIGFLEAFLNERSLDLCIVMEYADGGDLAGKVEKYKQARRYMDERTVWGYFLQIMEGTICLHDKKILHRDLKTANIFMSMDGHVKIGDMNVSKMARMGLVKTQIGTPYYMSPEIWQNRPYNDKSDIWSIGCILYELCALRPPFRGADLEDLAKRVQAGYYPRIPSQYSSDMDSLIRSMLQLDPRRRPSAKQVMEMPMVKRRVEEYRKLLNQTLITELASQDDGDMLATIQVPRNVRRITNNLPKPRYPDSRPHSPKLWPVSAAGRAAAIAAEAQKAAGGGLPAAIPEEAETSGGGTAHSEPAPRTHHSSPPPRVAPIHNSDPMRGRGGGGADVRERARRAVAAVPAHRPVGHQLSAAGQAQLKQAQAARGGYGGGYGQQQHGGYGGGGMYSHRKQPSSGYANNNGGYGGGYGQRHQQQQQYSNRNNYGVAVPRSHHGGHHGGHHKPSGAAALPVVQEHHRAAAPAVRQAPASHAGYHNRAKVAGYGGAGAAARAAAAYPARRSSRSSHASVASRYSRANPYSARSGFSQASSKPSWWG